MEGIFLWVKLELLVIQNAKKKIAFILKKGIKDKTVAKKLEIYCPIISCWMK